MAAIVLTRNMQLAKHHGTGVIGVLCLRSYSAAAAPPDADAPRPLKTTNVAAMKRGTGGRSSFNGIVATVFGATGFVGRYVCNKLGKSGTQMILPYRGDESDVIRLKVCGDLGQVLFHFYNLEDPRSIRDAVKHSNVVINLVGRDYETKNFKFKDVNVNGAARLASICRDSGVERFIHLSALNAEANPKAHCISGGSQWLKSKYEGELQVRDAFPNATIIRPADIYGSEDRFLRYYAHIWRRQFRSMPLWHNGELTVKQPVFVSDVAQAIVNAAKDPDSAGRIYQAVGPKRYQLSELVDWFHRLMRKDQKRWGYQRYDMRWDPTFKLKARLTSLICPGAPVGGLHLDRIEREAITDKVLPGVPTLEDLGVQLTTMEEQVPWELRPYRAALYYDAELGEFEAASPPKTIEAREELRLFA
ncbi:NADH dehydrogenase [ubiquinone] 1 alpha subcomplex subunit 9, mitochondrial [Drosophila grimshawi]|uniref:NADH dehydrogenase [ubiquinone] 1 alpha subcomplex subunit 9, mitochondrial n=1 Tax=Drosophila grimshawi TaxID=7222 RepID=B4IYY9_DROGR|nr:NADH dehydrogenase [ubiquinone] 1 alpha subcomplex subunit 9, mitochondrial [Drosophila grimshawi]EDV97697.1 GH14554 [Drosophila grimshawi]